MSDSNSTTSLTAVKLRSTCFKTEQERLEAFAAALRAPVYQAERGPVGERGSKGEKGGLGPTGPQGARGEKGDKGDKGTSPSLVESVFSVDSGASSYTTTEITDADFFFMQYDDGAEGDPPSAIGISCIVKLSDGIKFFFTGSTADDNWKIVAKRWS